MNRTQELDTLNRLHGILSLSLPMYLKSTGPWVHGPTEKALELLDHIATDQATLIDRITDAIEQRHGFVDEGYFSYLFTSLHDLAVEFLIRMVHDRQVAELDEIRQCVDELKESPLHSLAEEVLANQSEHLLSLSELLSEEEFAVY